jgi:hypothetical protein
MSTAKDASVDFFIAEFNALQQRAVQAEQSKATSTNLYLIIVAATLAGIPSLLTLVPPDLIALVLISAFLFVFIAGLLTLEYSINQSVISMMLYRRAGRIRRWFAVQDPNMQPFLPFEPNDDRPAIYITSLSFRGGETAAFVINNVTAALIVSVALSYLSWTTAIVGAIITFILAWILQRAYALKKLRLAENAVGHHILFPYARDKGRRLTQKEEAAEQVVPADPLDRGDFAV